jgi:hypothetical protein
VSPDLRVSVEKKVTAEGVEGRRERGEKPLTAKSAKGWLRGEVSPELRVSSPENAWYKSLAKFALRLCMDGGPATAFG